MNDGLVALGSAGVLGVGLGGAVALARHGVARTYVRDLVHVGTGVWVLGWPLWSSPFFPILITTCAAAAVVAGPRALRDALCGEDERWTGVAVYVVTYAVFTALAFLDQPFAAGAALLALSLGDGVGGLVGRRFGRHTYRAPGAKTKSIEGSVTVALMAMIGIAVASHVLGGGAGVMAIIAAGLVAAVVEGLAPRGTDNALVPAAVWIFLRAAQ